MKSSALKEQKNEITGTIMECAIGTPLTNIKECLVNIYREITKKEQKKSTEQKPEETDSAKETKKETILSSRKTRVIVSNGLLLLKYMCTLVLIRIFLFQNTAFIVDIIFPAMTAFMKAPYGTFSEGACARGLNIAVYVGYVVKMAQTLFLHYKGIQFATSYNSMVDSEHTIFTALTVFSMMFILGLSSAYGSNKYNSLFMNLDMSVFSIRAFLVIYILASTVVALGSCVLELCNIWRLRRSAAGSKMTTIFRPIYGLCILMILVYSFITIGLIAKFSIAHGAYTVVKAIQSAVTESLKIRANTILNANIALLAV
ncbi:hypothetical protein NEAUS05_1524 [Nematocida ausubeli]|nr:hypothetical protein NEAUS05_1524 [Nematocida ausubeli]